MAKKKKKTANHTEKPANIPVDGITVTRLGNYEAPTYHVQRIRNGKTGADIIKGCQSRSEARTRFLAQIGE